MAFAHTVLRRPLDVAHRMPPRRRLVEIVLLLAGAGVGVWGSDHKTL